MPLGLQVGSSDVVKDMLGWRRIRQRVGHVGFLQER